MRNTVNKHRRKKHAAGPAPATLYKEFIRGFSKDICDYYGISPKDPTYKDTLLLIAEILAPTYHRLKERYQKFDLTKRGVIKYDKDNYGVDDSFGVFHCGAYLFKYHDKIFFNHEDSFRRTELFDNRDIKPLVKNTELAGLDSKILHDLLHSSSNKAKDLFVDTVERIAFVPVAKAFALDKVMEFPFVKHHFSYRGAMVPGLNCTTRRISIKATAYKSGPVTVYIGAYLDFEVPDISERACPAPFLL